VADRFAVRWSRTAEQDLTAILEYIAREDGVDRAVRLYDDVRMRVATLTSMPRRARVVPELQAIGLEEFRELLAGPYRIFFRIDHRTVILLGVVDGRRDLAELLIERALRHAQLGGG
jgi:toxin ParE1/3/4